MLNPHTETNHLGCNSYLRLLLWGELPVGGRSRMTRKRLGIAHVHHPLEQAKRIEAFPAALVSTFHTKCQKRAEVGAQVSMRHRVKRIIREPDVVNPIDQRMIA